ncbi:MAG: hypothetical protein ACJ79C_14780 [Myxococcales bacterium]
MSLLGGPREPLPWSRHDPLTLFSGENLTINKSKPWTQEAYVVPQRPGKNQVRYFDFHWRDHDFLEEDGSAGIRFYFYDREYPVARIAAGLVRQSWAYLSDRFNYKPSFKVPYVLYNTYREFLETNVFDVQEGTLGVTSPQDLRMTLSYSGDRQLFTIVSTHEMVHQFQIQKVAERAASAGLESPIQAFPLWFTEGLAEYYAHGQTIDPETDMFLRDVVLNSQGEIGYDIPTLAEDRPYAYLYTYKYGQAKLVFLAEQYGEKVIQAVLDQSPRLAGSARRGEASEGFMGLLGRIAGEQPQQMNARWQEWVRKRSYPTFLQSKQDLPDVTELRLPDELDWFVSSRDGNLLFYRGVERESFRAKLVLIDRRDPSSAQQIAIDQHPGTESLHPVLRSVMAVCDTGIAWFAQSGDSDVLHYRTLNRVLQRPEYPGRDRGGGPKDLGGGTGAPGGSPESRTEQAFAMSGRGQVDLHLGFDRELRVIQDGVIEAGDPAFSPDCKRLAYYGLDRDGKSDIYVVDLADQSGRSRRLTDDLYAERDLSWGDDGIVYASDATESGKFNLFRIDPDDGTRIRLTDSPVDQRYPVAMPGEAALFSSEAGGKTDLWFLQNGRIKRLSDFSTALSHPGLAPNGIYGVAWYGARFRLMEVQSKDLLAVDEQDAIPASYASTVNSPLPFPDEPIPAGAPTYNAFDLGKNWRIEGGGAAIGGAGVGFAPVGQGGVLFADVLRDRTFLANFAIYGSFEFTDALAFYVDRSKRLVYGLGVFDTFQQGRAISFPGSDQCRTIIPPSALNPNPAQPPCQIFYVQKMYGVMGLASYPLSTFTRVEGTMRLQGVSRSLLENGVVDQFGNLTNIPTKAANSVGGSEPEGELSLAYGYDTTRYGLGGAMGGSSFLLEVGGGTYPSRGIDGMFTYLQTDAIHTIQIAGRSKITGRGALGYAQGSPFGRHFFLSSFDNLRGYRFNDTRLLGDSYYVTQAELSFPLDFLIRFAIFSGITGIVGLDFGGVAESALAKQNYPKKPHFYAVTSELWANRTMDYVLGVNLGLGPFELRVQFAHGVDIGGIIPERDSDGSPAWVPNISLHYAYF